MRIALVSEHASPLAVLGGTDAGGQNAHVAALGAGLAARGHEVTVHTRRDDPHLPRQVPLAPGVVVDHVSAGPAEPISKDDMFPYMDEFSATLRQRWAGRPPDVVHSHFWMSGYAAVRAARPLGIGVPHTFHALGVVKRREQGVRDTSQAERADLEPGLLHEADRILATCPDEVFELLRLVGDRGRITVVPCGVDTGLFTEPPHPAADLPGITVLHVTHFNELFWDCGKRRTEVIEHGIPDPGYRYTGELPAAAAVVNEPVRRGRVTETDLPQAAREELPVDLFGMGTPTLGGADLPHTELLAQLPRRRVYLHPVRWTSLGLSLIEAMHLGLPVAALATTEVPAAVPPA